MIDGHAHHTTIPTAVATAGRSSVSWVRQAIDDVRQSSIARMPLLVPRLSDKNRPRDAFGILMYHRIAENTPPPRPTYNVTPERLRQQLAGLLQRGYRAWPLRTVLDAVRCGRPIPPKTFVVTFDDGYENNYTAAWPILRSLEIPATIFVATRYLDSQQPFPFDDWAQKGTANVPVDSWRPMTSRQCAELAEDELLEIGCHTHTHEDFRDRPQDFLHDVRTSLAVLRERFGQEDATFAFPFGKQQKGFAGPQLVDAAQQAGVLSGLTTESELAGPHVDCFGWGRFTAAQCDSAATLAAKIDGRYTQVRNFWRRQLRRTRSSNTASHEDQRMAIS